MMWARLPLVLFVCSSIVIGECKIINNVRHDVRKFPEHFLFGTATASYQVEGAWDKDGKTENIWDHATHTNPCVVKDCSNGDIADDSYHQYKRDVEMMRELGLDFYRFSLSWTRILPTSFPDKINEAGVQYYNNLINEMLKYNIKPMITLYHWDLPQKLQDMGGWTNPEIVNWFADYARIAFELFSDRVTDWITINEPHQVCYHGYGDDTLAPLLNIKGVADYLCAKNLLLAHAKAYHIYDKEFRPSHGGKIFIALSAQWYDTEYEEFVDAAKEANDFTWAIYSHPIFSETGDFPPVVKKYVAQRSAEQGFYRSRLPEFTEEEIDYVRGTSDYFGLNHYLTYYVYRNQSLINYYESPSFEEDMGVITYIYDEWQIGESKYTKFVPWGFYKLLTRIREDYGNPPVIITENGFATKGGLNDEDRVTYYRHYISAMLDAMEEGSDVRAYTAWSLMDNFEWLAGYTERFGLYEVDYESAERTRTPRKSAFVYKQIVRTRELDMHFEPDTDIMTIDEGLSNDTYQNRHTMWSIQRILFFVIASIVIAECKTINNARHEVRKFPENFRFGAATASYQVEGAWDEDGKSENIWDHITHTNPCVVKDCSNGDIADDSYHQYKRDVEMMRELGLDFYRFSLSWTRILPTSFPDKINEAGVQYYNNLIDEMLKYNIKPMVTLYHWDLPQKLQEMGGWTNPNIIDWYSDYARVAFELFGDRVKDWITINEPLQVCYYGYGDNSLAPLLNIKGVADYMCAKNLLLAHAKAYHIYDKEFRPTQGGSIFISLSAQWHDTEHEEFADAAKDANEFTWGIYANPIFSDTGDFPEVMKKRVAAKSIEQGLYRSRLPEFTAEEIDYIRGSSDYFGLNHYSTKYVYRNESVFGYYESPSFYDDMELVTYTKNEWKIGESQFTKFVPWGFYKLLTEIKEAFGNPPVVITENGFATYGGLDDEDRVTYYKHYINSMLDAIEDGSDVRGYTAWSLMDNYEWLQGYTERFGLYEVDYESAERTRTPRKSAFVYKQILRTRELDMHYEPDTDVMTIDEGH
ncbi:lactase-phlorizin hydrolase [Papilio machaon]|uniref:lactase-phlorizin hydrolase n=1 Tax=Papilio machaon TaxID=76193 RepID=UPI001E665919|nr:lactase-phlorizin hydrolase [Papilio machaon]